MSAQQRTVASWVTIGSSQTSPVENKQRAQVALDRYYVVVGFEVNKPEAFVDDVHDLAVDYGHAFIYLVKNVTITNFFSFGPNGPGKIGWFNKGKVMTSKKDGYQNARPGTANYFIKEDVKAFKLSVTTQQAIDVHKEIDKLRLEIYNGSLEYSAIMNDTCAETAKEILDEAGVQTPSGSGWVKHSKMASVPIVYAVNPYSWHKNFKKAHPEMNFKRERNREWIPLVGEDDPIFGVPDFAKADPIFGVKL